MSDRNDHLDSEIADKHGVIIAAARGGLGTFRRHTGQALHFLTELAQRDFRRTLVRLVSALPALCDYDPRGYCQAHFMQCRPCPVEEARKLLAQNVGLDGAPKL